MRDGHLLSQYAPESNQKRAYVLGMVNGVLERRDPTRCDQAPATPGGEQTGKLAPAGLGANPLSLREGGFLASLQA